MKWTKNILISLMIVLIFIMNLFTVFSYEKPDLPYNIKIGLFFATTAKSNLLLENQFGFKAGIFNEDQFKDLLDINEKKIFLKKDKFYMDDDLHEEEAYHIQIGQSFKSYLEALDFLNSMNENLNSYLSYENEWNIYTGLYLNEEDAKKEATNIHLDYGYETKVINPSSTRVQVVNETGNPIFTYDSTNEVYFMGKNNQNNISIIDVEGTSYRGAITAKRLDKSDMTIINKLPLEEYLYGVVPGEMPASWHIEALKAQAVAARVFAITNLNKYKQYGFNLCSTINSQVYKGYTAEHPSTNKAVNETRSKVVTYNGKVVQTFYHSNSGGHTEDSENVWANSLPYARGVKDEFSLDSPHSSWKTTFTKEEIKTLLANHNIFIGDILDIKIISVSNNGRVLSLVIYGTEGEEVFEKEKSRVVFNLKSNYFSINSNNNSRSENEFKAINGQNATVESVNLKDKYMISVKGVEKIKDTKEITIFNGKDYKNVPIKQAENNSADFEFQGRGFGHGVGMSQYGARKMAELGYQYNEILNYYYTGVKVE